MSERIRDATGKRIRNGDGARSHDPACCCGECTAITCGTIFDALEAQGAELQVVIDPGDFSQRDPVFGLCLSGSCDGLAGTYTLPFDTQTFATIPESTWTIFFTDDFTVTFCDTERTVSVSATVECLESPRRYRVGVTINSNLFGPHPQAGLSYGSGEIEASGDECSVLLETTFSCPAASIGFTTDCYTDGSEGAAEVTLLW